MAIINPVRIGGSTLEPTTGDYLVRFIDFDGTILKEQWVNTGEAATAPPPPTHQYLTFDEWNNDFTNVQHDIDVGATYRTTDGKTYLFMRFTNTTGLQPAIYLRKSDTSLMTITWGDGTSQTTSASKNVAITKTDPYTAIGDYNITIECAGDWSYYTYIFNNKAAYNSCLLNCYLGENVTSIGGYAFAFCYSLTSIVIPDSVTSIGIYAFRRCYLLTSIVIPDSVTSIENGAISYCYALTSIVIPDGVTSIEDYAFASCYALTSIVIPDGVTSIEDYAFASCYALTSIVIPDSVTSIGGYAFSDCYELTSIVIPDSVTSIGGYAFSDCYELTSIVIPDGVTSIEDYAFAFCYALTSIVIPDGVTSIGDYAFRRCYLLTSIVIPDSVTSIGNGAISYCYSLINQILSYNITTINNVSFAEAFSLKIIIIEAVTPPSLASINAFTGINLVCKIYVPDASVSAYQDATNWNTYASYIYPVSELSEYAGTIFWQTNGADPIREWRGTPGTLAPLPHEPAKAGFTFAGWYKDEALTAEWDQNTDVCPTTNLTLYAKWI